MLSRRRLLALGVCCGLTGCAAAPDRSSDATDSATGPEASTDSPQSTGSASTEADRNRTPDSEGGSTLADAESQTTDDGLDLREANVVGVELDATDGSYRFSVTLYHDDDGEDGYADWWQVETLDGDRLGRRTLLHAHSTAPFTRSETIRVPDGVTHVVVRGHDQTHGYGGQAMVVAVGTGATEAVRQGTEPRDLSGYEPSV
jgi:hypothetical protein